MLLVLGGVARAQSAVTVPASSALYDRLETISAWYPVRGLFLGERPMSMRDARRVVALLSRRVDSAVDSDRRLWARDELALLRVLVDQAEPRHASVSWRTRMSATNASSERIEPNGLGGRDSVTQQATGIDALRNSFDAGRDGIPVDRAAVAALPVAAVGARSSAFVIEPLLVTSGGSADSGRWAPALHRAYARAIVHNVAARVGADELRWGQSPNGALFISGNAAPLRALTIGTDTPVTLPWLFRLAGPFRITGLLADLGRSAPPSHARLAGWQGSIEPWSRFELGVTVLAETGGSGGPKASFLERFVDLFPVIDALAPQHADIQISNKLAGGNLRLRFPELSGLDFYYELQIDDFDARRLRSSLVEDAGHLLGLRLPLLVDGHPFTWRAEWQRTSLRLYEHAQFLLGVTYHSRIIGNPLGPNAKGAYLSARIGLTHSRSVDVSISDERRNPSIFSSTSNDGRDRGFRFVLDTLKPDHRRDQAVASIEQRFGRGIARLSVGAARRSQQGQEGRTEWLAEIAFRRDLLRLF